MTERWDKIPGFEDYEASTFGKIRSLKHGKMRIIAQHVDSNGYLACGIQQNGKTRTMKVHRLIAFTFIPNPENKPTVNHLFGDKWDNYYLHLAWATQSEQIQHAWDIGLNGNSERTYLQKTACIEAAKKSVNAIDTKTGETKTYVSVTECSIALEVTQSCVSHALIRGNKIKRQFKISYL